MKLDGAISDDYICILSVVFIVGLMFVKHLRFEWFKNACKIFVAVLVWAIVFVTRLGLHVL